MLIFDLNPFLDRVSRDSERVQGLDPVLHREGDGVLERRRVLPHQDAPQADSKARTW